MPGCYHSPLAGEAATTGGDAEVLSLPSGGRSCYHRWRCRGVITPLWREELLPQAAMPGCYHSPLEGESARQGRSPPGSRWGDLVPRSSIVPATGTCPPTKTGYACFGPPRYALPLKGGSDKDRPASRVEDCRSSGVTRAKLRTRQGTAAIATVRGSSCPSHHQQPLLPPLPSRNGDSSQ